MERATETREAPRLAARVERGGALVAAGGIALCALACAAPLLMGAGALAVAGDLEVVGVVLAVFGVGSWLTVKRLAHRRASTCNKEVGRGC